MYVPSLKSWLAPFRPRASGTNGFARVMRLRPTCDQIFFLLLEGTAERFDEAFGFRRGDPGYRARMMRSSPNREESELQEMFCGSTLR